MRGLVRSYVTLLLNSLEASETGLLHWHPFAGGKTLNIKRYCDKIRLVGFEVVTAVVMESSLFSDIMLDACFMLVSCSALKMEAACSSETSAEF
jgi:hypothetical protein